MSFVLVAVGASACGGGSGLVSNGPTLDEELASLPQRCGIAPAFVLKNLESGFIDEPFVGVTLSPKSALVFFDPFDSTSIAGQEAFDYVIASSIDRADSGEIGLWAGARGRGFFGLNESALKWNDWGRPRGTSSDFENLAKVARVRMLQTSAVQQATDCFRLLNP